MKFRSKLWMLATILFLFICFHVYSNLNQINSKIKRFEKLFLEGALKNTPIGVEEVKTTKNSPQTSTYNNDKNLVKTETTCNILKPNAKQYQVNIDGEIYPKLIPLRENKTIDFNCINRPEKKPKLILYWTPFYDMDNFYFGLGKYDPFKNHKCPAYNCETTKDKSRLNESDIVVFSLQNQIHALPKEHKKNQEWVFVLIESPANLAGFDRYNNVFNTAVTYRRDADYQSHYSYEGHYEWGINPDYNENYDYYEGKTDFAAIVVSNCHKVSSMRLEYVNELQKYINATIFGACGRKCLDTFDNGIKGDCKVIIAQKYKFFFAFENSMCKDYITEKFFIILRFNIIPVVLGAGEYDMFIPKSGYINVKDYKSPKELADYLLYLDRNRTAYNSYFKWKKHIIKTYDGIFAAEICEFCIKAHLNDVNKIDTNKVIKDFSTYWNSANDCKPIQKLADLSNFKLT